MAKPFRELVAKMSPEAKSRAEERTREMLKEMPLHELRAAFALSQEQIANSLNIKQPAISKMERRVDMYISTLRNFIKAMGGDLEIIAHFPDGSVRLNQFHEADTVKGDG